MTLRKFIRQVTGCLALALVFGTGSASAAPVLQIDGSGILTGAKGVLVNGVLYDVVFQEGTCIAVFGGCDQASDFTFPSASGAQAASAALMAQVFLDSPAGLFDTHPNLTFGCDPGTLPCSVTTPFGIAAQNPSQFQYYDAANAPLEVGDAIAGAFSLAIDFDTRPHPFQVFAVWTQTVPEPSSIALVGLAGLALAGVSRRRTTRKR